MVSNVGGSRFLCTDLKDPSLLGRVTTNLCRKEGGEEGKEGERESVGWEGDEEGRREGGRESGGRERREGSKESGGRERTEEKRGR